MSALEILQGRARSPLGAASVGFGYETLAWNLVPTYVMCMLGQLLRGTAPRVFWGAVLFSAGMLVLLPVGGRELLGLSIAGALLVYHYRVRPIPNWFAPASGVALLVMAAVVGGVRQQSGPDSLLDSAAYTSLSFDGFESLVALHRRFSATDVVWGRQYLESIFLTFIPRLVWPDKPVIFGSLDASNYVFPELVGSFGNIGTYPIGFVAESLYNFWYFGLIFVPIGIGLLGGVVERGARMTGRQSSLFPIIAGTMSGSVISWMRSAGDAVLGLLLTLFVSWLFLRLDGRWSMLLVRAKGREAGPLKRASNSEQEGHQVLGAEGRISSGAMVH